MKKGKRRGRQPFLIERENKSKCRVVEKGKVVLQHEKGKGKKPEVQIGP